MAIITMPASVRIQRIDWRLDRPAQVNRSAYTGARQVVGQPGQARWSASVALSPIIGETNVLAWRAFLAKLKGQINTFRLIAVEGSQTGSTPLSGGASAGAVTLTSYGWLPASSGTVLLAAGRMLTISDQLVVLTADASVSTAPTAVTNSANTTVAAAEDTGEYRITKTGGVNGNWDASAVTAAGFANDYLLRIQPKQTNKNMVVGVSLNPTASVSYTGIDRGISFSSAGIAEVMTLGTPGASLGAYTTDQIWWMARTSGTLRIYRGADLATATLVTSLSALAGTAFLDTAFSDSAGAVDVIFSQVTVPLTFEPPLRATHAATTGIEASLPTSLVALVDSEFAWSVDPGQLYGIAFEVEEAF
jgi:hypothetical protein